MKMTKAGGLAVLLLAAALAGCSSEAMEPAQSSPTSAMPVQAPAETKYGQVSSLKGTEAAPEVSSTPVDAAPTNEAADGHPVGGPAFEPETSGAPVVKREDELPEAAAVTAPVAEFTHPSRYDDGVIVTVGDFARGVVEDKGAGLVTGAAYVLIDVTVDNGSAKDLDLTRVVATLRHGDEGTVAAPLYAVVPTADLYGVVPPGGTLQGTYAFQVPPEIDAAKLFLDLNGSHRPATFAGKIP